MVILLILLTAILTALVVWFVSYRAGYEYGYGEGWQVALERGRRHGIMQTIEAWNRSREEIAALAKTLLEKE